MEDNWTILKVLQWTAEFFSRKGIEQARANAEVLLAHVLGLERVQLYIHFDKPLNEPELAAFREAIRRRAAREPSQYITKRQEFWSLEFEVTPAVLIPRPETEVLVESALEALEGAPSLVLDIGTGSGAVAVVLVHEHPRVRAVAADICPRAVEVAKRNAERHGTLDRMQFVVSDLFSAFRDSEPLFDLVVSNPPYIAESDFQLLPPEIARHEPSRALRGGGVEGLDVIRRIIGEAPAYLKPGGWMMLEIGIRQAPVLEAELRNNPFFHAPRFRDDYAGIPRVLMTRRK